VLGLMTVYSANADWGRQAIWVGLGIGAYVAAACFDYRRLQGLVPGIYAAMLLLLVAVHLVGHSALGARRWLSIAGFPLEPSELSKLLLVVVMAALLSRAETLSWRRLGIALLMAGPAAALIVAQPDLGTAIVFTAIFAGMLFVAGARPAQI